MFKKLESFTNPQHSDIRNTPKQDPQPSSPASFVTGNGTDVKQATDQHEYKNPFPTISAVNSASANTLPLRPSFSHQPPIKKPRLESLHLRNTSPFSLNHNINNNNMNPQLLARPITKPREPIEVIALSDSDDDKSLITRAMMKISKF